MSEEKRDTQTSASQTRPRADIALRFTEWQIGFVQDCNLRCTYCGTGYGATGKKPGYMTEDLCRRLTAFVFAHTPEDQPIELGFSVGETFLHYEAFIRFADLLRREGHDKGISLKIHVSTNGTLLNPERLEALAERGIALTFSIDGPQILHDQCRKDPLGRGSFERAIENWRYYRALCTRNQRGSACVVHSVVSEHTRLADVIPFWLEQDLTIFDAVVQNPSSFASAEQNDGWHRRQELFLADFESWAMEQAQRLNVPGFLSEYTGPRQIFDIWQRLFLEREKPLCGAGLYTLAVDIDGDLYPCDALKLNPKWRVGNVIDGIDRDRLMQFRAERHQASHQCQSCEVKPYCPKSCFAMDPEASLAENFDVGCYYAKQCADIASRSYTVLSKCKEKKHVP